MSGENNLNKFSIAKKLMVFGIIVTVVVLISTIVKYKLLSDARNDFRIYSQKAVEGKFLVLNLKEQISKVKVIAQEIILLDSSKKDIEELQQLSSKIDSLLNDLEKSFKGTINQDKKLADTANAKEKVSKYVDFVLSTIKSANNNEDKLQYFNSINSEINKLNKNSLEALEKVVAYKNKGLVMRTKMYEDEMSSLFFVIIVEAIVILVILVGYLILLTKNITTSLRSFKTGLLSFFDFLNGNTKDIEEIKINTKDEFLEMADLVNRNIQLTKSEIEDDNKLIADAAVVIERVKHGWYSQHIEQTTSNETLNILKDGINDMIKATKNHIVSINETLKRYSNYDYTQELVVQGIEKGGVFEQLITDINNLRNAITVMLVENKSNGLTLEDNSKVLMDNVQELSDSSNQAAASLEQTAAALEEITSNINSDNVKVAQMSNYANDLSISSSEGEKLASQTTSAMDEINEKVTAINEAITVIDQIAFQTNILSLNAAVEAATAGEAGKGFAVVAQEVRNLASRSADAAKEIKELVEDATLKASSGKSIASKMIEGYSRLNENITKTLQLIKDVENSSREQLSGISQINDAVNSLDKQTQQNAFVASVTKTIAQSTQDIATTVVRNANEKQFSGKDDVKAFKK